MTGFCWPAWRGRWCCCCFWLAAEAACGAGAGDCGAGAGRGFGDGAEAGSALVHGGGWEHDGAHRHPPGDGGDSGTTAGLIGWRGLSEQDIGGRMRPEGAAVGAAGLGLLVGMPVFFEVGLVLLMPIVAESARRSGRPPILVGMPVLAGLSTMHGLIPPHPAALLAAAVYHADLGRTILWGLVAGVPAAAVAGPVLGWVLMRRWERQGKLPVGDAEGGEPAARVIGSVASQVPEAGTGAPNTRRQGTPRALVSEGICVDPTHHEEAVMNGAPTLWRVRWCRRRRGRCGRW